VVVASVVLAVTVEAWPRSWYAPAFREVIDLIPRWVLASVWFAIASVFAVDLARPVPVRVAIVAATVWCSLCMVFATAITVTTIQGSSSAIGSAVMWCLVTYLSIEHVRRYR
jgi:hypothetical protein